MMHFKIIGSLDDYVTASVGAQTNRFIILGFDINVIKQLQGQCLNIVLIKYDLISNQCR